VGGNGKDAQKNSEIWTELHLITESEVFVEAKANVASRVGGFDRAVVKFGC